VQLADFAPGLNLPRADPRDLQREARRQEKGEGDKGDKGEKGKKGEGKGRSRRQRGDGKGKGQASAVPNLFVPWQNDRGFQEAPWLEAADWNPSNDWEQLNPEAAPRRTNSPPPIPPIGSDGGIWEAANPASPPPANGPQMIPVGPPQGQMPQMMNPAEPNPAEGAMDPGVPMFSVGRMGAPPMQGWQPQGWQPQWNGGYGGKGNWRKRREDREDRQAPPAKVDLAIQYGVVKSFAANRGFGLITPEEGEGEIFVYWTDIQSEDRWPKLDVGERVQYTTETDVKGQVQAKNVQLPGGGMVVSNARQQVTLSAARYRGFVKWFGSWEGSGAITLNMDADVASSMVMTGDDVLVTREELVCTNAKNPKVNPGMEVEFLVAKAADGTYSACEVTQPGGLPLP